MLRFRLHQVHVPSLGKFFLPLPKLGSSQLATLSDLLAERGFGVRRGTLPSRLFATRVRQRISIDGLLGLASSSGDVLDALAPSIPPLLEGWRSGGTSPRGDVSSRYFAFRRSPHGSELQLLPRLESLRTWTCLRADGLSGLVPDEARVLRVILKDLPADRRLDCVTAHPRGGSTPLQVGKRVYYRSNLQVGEFLSALRVLGSDEAGPVSYLPRDSLIRLGEVKTSPVLGAGELGEWCLTG